MPPSTAPIDPLLPPRRLAPPPPKKSPKSSSLLEKLSTSRRAMAVASAASEPARWETANAAAGSLATSESACAVNRPASASRVRASAPTAPRRAVMKSSAADTWLWAACRLWASAACRRWACTWAFRTPCSVASMVAFVASRVRSSSRGFTGGALRPARTSAIVCSVRAITPGTAAAEASPAAGRARAVTRSVSRSASIAGMPDSARCRSAASLSTASTSSFAWSMASSAARMSTAAALASPAVIPVRASASALVAKVSRSAAWSGLSATVSMAAAVYRTARSATLVSAWSSLTSIAANSVSSAAAAAGALASSCRNSSNAAACSSRARLASAHRAMIWRYQARTCSSVSGSASSRRCCRENAWPSLPAAPLTAAWNGSAAAAPYWASAKPTSCPLVLIASSVSISALDASRFSSAVGTSAAACPWPIPGEVPRRRSTRITTVTTAATTASTSSTAIQSGNPPPELGLASPGVMTGADNGSPATLCCMAVAPLMAAPAQSFSRSEGSMAVFCTSASWASSSAKSVATDN
nr:hypothetical protein BJQ95_01417 [Cryobacterium sp. SO1]